MSQAGRYVMGTGGGAPIETLTGNVGGPVAPDGAGNIDLLGGNHITTTGNPGAFNITFDLDGTIADTFTTDAGNAIPVAGVLNVLGGLLLNTSGAGNTVTIHLDNANDGQIPIAATAGNVAYANITSADATVVITNGPNSIDLSTAGGADLLTYTAVNTTPYVVLATDEFLGVDVSGAPIIIQLPNGPAVGRVFYIKDSTGNANINNISVTTVGGVVTIDGVTTYTMNTQFSSISVIFNGASFEIF